MTMDIDTNNYMWIGTDGGGLTRYNQKTNSFKHFKHTDSDKNSISSNRVWSILVDKKALSGQAPIWEDSTELSLKMGNV